MELVEQELISIFWERITDQFRSLVGMTAFEDLCREWVLAKARTGELPVNPEIIGAHWPADAQVDVAAINWRDKPILLGECKWIAKPVGRSVIRELIDKTSKAVPKDEPK